MNEDEQIEEVDTEMDEERELNEMEGFAKYMEMKYLDTDQVFDSTEMVQHLAMLEKIKQFCNDIIMKAEKGNRRHLLELANAVYKRVRDVQRMIEKKYFNK